MRKSKPLPPAIHEAFLQVARVAGVPAMLAMQKEGGQPAFWHVEPGLKKLTMYRRSEVSKELKSNRPLYNELMRQMRLFDPESQMVVLYLAEKGGGWAVDTLTV